MSELGQQLSVLCFDCFYVGPASIPMLDQGLVVHDCSSCLLYACMHWTKARLVGVGGCWCVLRSCFVLEVGWFVSLFCVFKLHWLRVSLVCRCLCETFFMLHFSWQGHRSQSLNIYLGHRGYSDAENTTGSVYSC